MRKYFELISVNPKTPQQLDTVVIPIAIALFHKIDILLIMMETITRDS